MRSRNYFNFGWQWAKKSKKECFFCRNDKQGNQVSFSSENLCSYHKTVMAVETN